MFNGGIEFPNNMLAPPTVLTASVHLSRRLPMPTSGSSVHDEPAASQGLIGWGDV